MDLTSKRMYDIFKEQIWKDLGPLDPNWFETLTAEGLAGHASEDELCANQEALLKRPTEIRGPCSQMCSTPKLFKHRPTSSPQTENESAEPDTLPWTKASPSVLQMEPSQTAHLFAVLHSPKKIDAGLHHSPDHSNTCFARHISERLGATVGDISWTSSLNTPPPEPSTLILSRKESSSTVTLSEDTYLLARTLFPLNLSADGIVPESPDQTTCLVPDAELNGSLQAPMKDKPAPSVTEDVAVHNEAETENSTFCTMSSSILRKVRNERVYRRLITPSSDNSRGAVKISPRRTAVLNESSEAPSGNTDPSQWSPLSLSEIPTHSGVTWGKQDSGLKETKHDMDKPPPTCAFVAESKKFPASELDQGHTADNVTEKTLQRSQLSLAPHFSQVCDPASSHLPHGFSPAACLSALKRAKQRAKRGSAFYQCCEIISDQGSESAMKQSGVHDSGFYSVAETTLASSTDNTTSAAVTVVEKEVSESICPTEEVKGDHFSDLVSFKTASKKNINTSPVNLANAKHFTSNMEEKERHTQSGTSNDDFHLTVSQKAEVNELCALLEQQSASQFEFTQLSVKNVAQVKQCPSPGKSETDFDAVKSENLLATGDTTSRALTECNKRENVLLKIESASDAARRLSKIGDQTGNHFGEGDLNTCQGFKTARGEEIGMCARSMQKALNFFKHCDLAPENVGVGWNVCDNKESGFKNTPVIGNVFPQEDICGSSDQDTETFRKPCLNVIDFVKANKNTKSVGKNVTPLPTPRRGCKRAHDTHPVSAKSVKRAKLLLSDCKEEYIQPHDSKPISNSLENGKTGITNIATLSSGFTTAGGKQVQLSDKDFEKVKHLWKDFDDSLKTANEFHHLHLNGASSLESTTRQKASITEDDSRCKTKPLQPGHSTSSTASQQSSALPTVGGRKAEHRDGEGTAHFMLSNPLVRVKDSAPGTRGFVSASGKALGVSAEALLKGKAMFDDVSSSSETREALEMPKAVTLAENTVNHVAENTKTTKSCSKSSDDHSSLHLSEFSPELEYRVPDFTTASGKKVVISEEALNGAKRLLTEVTQSKNGLQGISLNKTIQRNGLQCTKGNSLNKSSTTVLVSPGDHDCKSFLHNTDCLGSGFTTASGKKVVVSEEALNVAKRILTEEKELRHGLQDIAQGKIIPANEPQCKKGNSINQSSSPYPVPSDGYGFCMVSGAASTIRKTLSVESVLPKSLCDTNSWTDNKSSIAEASAISSTTTADVTDYLKKRNKDGSNLSFRHSTTNLNDTSASDNSCVKTSISGFTTASGKKVTVSEEALYKAINFLAEEDQNSDANVQVTNNNKNELSLLHGHSIKNLDNSSSNISCVNNSRSGFTTASGKKVAVSEEALNKARNFLMENINQDRNANVHNKNKLGLPDGHFVNSLEDAPDNSCVKNDRSGFTTASGKKVTVSEEALNKAVHFLTEKVEQGSVNAKNKAGLSLHAGHLITNLNDTLSSNDYCVKRSRSGFTTASGKKVTVSEEALNKAKNCLAEDVGQDSDVNVQVTKKNNLSLHHEHSGTKLDHMSSNISCVNNSRSRFTTVSGKKATVSEEALNKAMNFLTEKNKKDSDADVRVTNENEDGSSLSLGHSTNMSNMSSNISCIKSRGGFTTASGKKVSVSEEALNKAMNFLAEDIDQDSDAKVTKKNTSDSSLPQGYQITNLDDTLVSTISSVKNSRSGFTTASGNKVTVSEEALNKAVNFLTEKMDLDCDVKTCTAELMPGKSNAMVLQHSFQPEFVNGAFSSADNFTSDLNPPTKRNMMKVPPVSLNIQKDAAPFWENDQLKSPDKKSLQHCPIVNLDVPNFGDCTTTQQKFLAQEALDCTRALLEDEVRAAQRLTASSEHVPTPATLGSHTGKRRLEGVTDLPGLERKSPEDSDEALDRQRESSLNPMKSSSGLCKDRRVFQYHVPLHPNVTRSHGVGKDYVNTKKVTSAVPSKQDKSGQADLKTPLFVPPFLNTRAKAPKDNVHAQKDKEKLCTFVPPFKKLKTEENSLKMQHKYGNFVKESHKTSSFTLPTRKSQNQENDCRSKPDNLSDQANQSSPQCEVTIETEDIQEAQKHTATEQRAMEGEETRQQGVSQKILLNLENLDLAQDLQELRIRKKSRQTIRPIPGSLFLTKSSSKRRSFRSVVNGQTPQNYSQKQLYTFGVDQPVCKITSETAEEFCFSLLKFYKRESILEAGGVQLADGGWLVPRRDGTVGKEEFYRALCDTPGVDPKLLSQSWVSNHYRWVVWKLASMERAFPASMASVCLTPEQVLLQLKYRYDVEVDHSRRPCLRKIMERDDTSAKTLVLCVCGIVSTGQPTLGTLQDSKALVEQCGAVVWLTDGWYTIRAQLDEPLTALLHRGTISEGVKLITHGAQLVGSQEACSPLEAPDTLILKIFANSTRRVRWDTKLGFYKNPRPFVLPLSSVFSVGGVVCCVDMVILRVYPTQWMERKSDGGVVFRSERAEEKEARRYNNHKQKTMEAMYAKIKAEFENEEKERMKGRRRTVRREDLCRCQDGEELYEAVGDEADVEAYLTAEQLQSLSGYRRTLLEQRQATLQERLRRAVEEAEASEGSCPRRDTSTVWRLCISDYKDQTGCAVYQLSIWNPSSDVQAALKEGGRYEACNLTASEGRSQSGRANVQLTSTRKTHFRKLQALPYRLMTLFQPRVSVTFADLQKPGFVPLCGEVDLTGCVLRITDPHGPSPAFYLVDGSLNFVKVLSVVSFARCGWEELLELRGLLCLSNLQVRVGCASPTPVLYAGDMSALSAHPRENHLRQALGQLQQAIQDQEDFFIRAETRLFEIMSGNGLSFSAVSPKTPQSAKTGHELSTSVLKRQAAAFTSSVRTPGLSNPPTKKDPRSLKRRRALDYLCQFPPPPPLSHLSSGASSSVQKTFFPPRRSLTPSLAPGKTVESPGSSSVPGTSVCGPASEEEGWVHDVELALIDTQELLAADALSD